VGYQLTLADAWLIATILGPFKTFLDKKQRDSSLPNLTRYVHIHSQGYHFNNIYGKVEFCQKFTLKIPELV